MALESLTASRAWLRSQRIVIVLYSFELGGAERQALVLARYLKDVEEADVQVWAFHGPGRAGELCDAYGITWRIVPLTCTAGGYPRFEDIIRFGWTLRQAQPRVILPYTMLPNVLCGIVWRWTGARLCVWNQRDEGIHRTAYEFERWAIRKTPLFVCNSHGGANFLVHNLGVKNESVRIIRNGVALGKPEMDRMTWRARLNLSEDSFVACIVANLSPEKDHATLLRAWRLVVNRMDKLQRSSFLLLAGYFYSTYDRLQVLCHDLALESNVRFLGPIKDIPGLLQAVDLAVLSSRSEGCPNGILEPMAAGLAVAGTDIPGIRDVIGPGGHAFLAPPGDAAALADRIVTLALDPELRAKLGNANQKLIENEFSSRKMCENMVDLINESITRDDRMHLGWFDLKDFFYLIQYFMVSTTKRVRPLIGSILVKVLLTMGRVLGFFLRWGNPSSLFFFFPVYHVGGAEKVHADIVACVASRKPWVFFANKSENQKFKSWFEDNAKIFDISNLANHRFMSHVLLGAMATVINRHKNAVVFGSNNTFFYRLIPFLKADARIIDLLHAFGGGVELVSLLLAPRVDTRVVVNTETFYDLKEQYDSHGFDMTLLERVIIIENEVSVPESYPTKTKNGVLKILYVGRGTEEKRVHLVGRAAARCHELGMPAKFIFVGEVAEAVEVQHHDYCTFKGEITDPDQLKKFYEEAHLLVLTSSREGFPVVIMEAMAYGVVPVSTSVGGIPLHVKHRINGMLVTAEDEDGIVESVTGIVKELSIDQSFLNLLSHNAYEYARKHFEPARFCNAYRQLLLSGNKSI